MEYPKWRRRTNLTMNFMLSQRIFLLLQAQSHARLCRRAGQSGVISDLIFAFTPDYAEHSPAFFNCFCPNLSDATEYRSCRNNLLKYRPLTGGIFLLWSVILNSNKSVLSNVLRKVRLETKLSLFFP